jgi:hypothetical protein
MPLFEYVFQSCGFTDEILSNLKDDIEVEFCKKCKGVMTRKFPLPQKHIMVDSTVSRLENKFGTYEADASALKTNDRSPNMWKKGKKRPKVRTISDSLK